MLALNANLFANITQRFKFRQESQHCYSGNALPFTSAVPVSAIQQFDHNFFLSRNASPESKESNKQTMECTFISKMVNAIWSIHCGHAA